MELYVVIVAGGSGKRMGAEIPKQFLELAGRPVQIGRASCRERVYSYV
jgi:2-C-methyl-D-erythritol 4-phosphate cytidylyltransferase